MSAILPNPACVSMSTTEVAVLSGGIPMLDRNLKALFTALLGLMALFFVINNFVNLEQAHGSLAYVLSLTDHTAYPKSFVPPLTPAMAWLPTIAVLLAECATAAVCLLGALRLWTARKDAAAFAEAKKTAKLGAGLAIFTWFGLFTVFGSAAYQMWQTEIGDGSASGAFTFTALAFFTLLHLGQPEAE
ncbi:DUF2165 family protein [Altererythrobacter confluentis]|uniref:DUF2165 family protein n=1 Tax=Allopontixanthobacter confluentis TaxID=1849021 RepID=A0A6L7GG78_9SPHN|nr:DUF2165 family protein [Allopontixanthobacter confluentis]MXP14314.1 DUF2165 family protein [Allopontixanthobacter confluentis]